MLSIGTRVKPNLTIFLNKNLKCSSNLHINVNKDLLPSQIGSFNQVRTLSFQDSSTWIVKSIANSTYVDYTQKTLINIHDFTGLPWYLEIILTSFTMRTLLIPFYWYEKRLEYTYQTKAVPEMRDKTEKIREQVKRKLQLREFHSEKQANRFFLNQQALAKKEIYIKYNVHPMKRIICILAPIPFWIVISFSIGGLCSNIRQMQFIDKKSIVENINFARPKCEEEGCLWFIDLTTADQYCILSAIFLAVFLLLIEYNVHIRRYNWIEDTRFIKIFTNLMRTFSILLFYASTSTPSGLTLYWTCNAITVFVQNVMLLNPKVKKVLKIHDTISKHRQPSLISFKEHLIDRYLDAKAAIKKKREK